MWPVDGAAQSPAPSPGLPRLAASRPRCTTPRLSSSVYSFQIRSCCFFFGSLFCVMVFQLFFHSSPPPRYLPPMAGFLRRTRFWRKLHAHLLSGCREGPVRGSGLREPGHTGQWRPGGRARGAWQRRPVVGTLPTAGRAEPQGPGVLPKTWGCSSPAPCLCWLWLLAHSAQICVCQT